jgi:hypothetical protein
MSIAGSLTDAINFRYVFTISGTPTTVSGADDNSKTLAYNVGFVDVYLNGVKQVVGTDVTATSGSTLVFASALAANDIVEAVTFDTFTSATAAIVGTRSEFNYVISGVFLNGVRMKVGTDVTASNGTEVVFASALAAGDLVDIVAHQNFSIANLPASSIGSGTLSNDRLPTGTILQVVNSIKTDTLASAGANAWNDIGLSVAITPRSTSSKILVNVSVSGGLNNSNTWLAIVRDSTYLGLGDAAGSRLQCTFGSLYTFGDANIMKTHSFQLLDSPSSTSQLTYKVQVRSLANTWYINRGVADADSVDHGRASSTITLMEVQG